MDTSPERTENNKDVWMRDSKSHRAQAPLAACFKDCAQTFQVLRSTVEDDPFLHHSYGFRISECHSKFVSWGNETGASGQLAFDQNLDYTLRKASELQRSTLKVLGDLHETLKRAVHEARAVSAAAARGFADEIRFDSYGATAGSVPILLDNLDSIIIPQDLRPAPQKKDRSDSPESHRIDDDGLSEGSLDNYAWLHQIDYVEEKIVGLQNLIPVLMDPAPLDTYSEYATSSQSHDEIEIVEQMFPNISSVLKERFGSANRKRRLYFRDRSDRVQGNGIGNLPSMRRKSQTGSSLIQGFSAVPQSEDRQSQEGSKKIFRRTRSISSFTTSKADDSIFSSGLLHSIDSISMTEPSTFAQDHRTGWPITHLSIPTPPTTLDSGNRFICPYCLLEIYVGDQITSESDWNQHVFMDVEPYLCTFENCVRPDKMFGSLEEWFSHELSSHRVSKVWVCQLCVEDFNSSKDFEEHLKKQHIYQLVPDQISAMISSCERYSDKPLSDHRCPLCQVIVQKTEKFKKHLGYHLEQLALTSIIADEDSGDFENHDKYENTSQTRVRLELIDDYLNGLPKLRLSEDEDSGDFKNDGNYENTSQTRVKLELVNYYVKKRFELRLPDEDQEFSNLDFVGDDSDDEPDSVAAVSIKPAEVALWKTNVPEFLDAQSQIHTDSAKLEPSLQSDLEHHLPTPEERQLTGPVRTKPPPRSEEFVGRDDDLKRINRELSQRGRICILSGIPGIGKTTISVEYTYRYATDFAYIFWVQAETSIGFIDTFGLIATQLNLGGDDIIHDQDRLVTMSREFLERTQKRWLLIFDNVSDGANIKQFLPINFPEGNGSLLLTTRHQDFRSQLFASQCGHVNLGPWKLEEARQFLLQSIEPGSKIENIKAHPEHRVAGDISSLVERLPLALSHIAGYVRSSNISLEKFRELWIERRSVEYYPGEQALETMWNIGQSELKTDGLALMHILAFFDNDNIPKTLLVGEHKHPSLEFLHSSQANRYRRITTELSNYRLIHFKEGQNAVATHQVLQSNILQALDRDVQKREQVFTQAFELVRSRFPRSSEVQIPEPAKWPICKEYLPHLVSLRNRFFKSNPPITPTLPLAKLIADGGFHLWERGVIIQGLSLLRQAEAILNKLDCKEDLLRGDIHIIIALLIQYFGISHRAEALDRLWKTLQIRQDFRRRTQEEDYTREHEVLLFNAWSDYGGALLQYNRYSDAEPIFHKCFSKYQEWGTEEDIPFEYAKFYRHIAFCRLYQRNFSSAIEYSKNGVRLMAMAIGESFHIHAFKFDLACIFLQSGDLVKALELHEEVFSARVKLHGPSGLLTLQSSYAIGALNAYLGNLHEAERWMRGAIEQASRASWPEVAVARTEFHLGQILRGLGKDLDEADALTANAETVLEKLLPLDPLPNVPDEDKLALFDHLQPLFDGRFTGRLLLKYVS